MYMKRRTFIKIASAGLVGAVSGAGVMATCFKPSSAFDPKSKRFLSGGDRQAAAPWTYSKLNAAVTADIEHMTPREYFDSVVSRMVPLGREQTEEDMGRAVVFLVSEDAKNITGQALNIDGGVSMV